ncbi:hypothetical protein N9Z11_00065 [Mariniblastus sp.]|nr:hypothetical protein [Mariniblastus sp.]
MGSGIGSVTDGRPPNMVTAGARIASFENRLSMVSVLLYSGSKMKHTINAATAMKPKTDRRRYR